MATKRKNSTDPEAAKPPQQSAAQGNVASASSLPPLLTQDERQSPLFVSLRGIDKIEDPDERLKAALDRLEHISRMALGRVRTIGKDQREIIDPDCGAACKVEELAHRLLSIEPRRLKVRAPDLAAFNEPLRVAK